MDSVYQSSLIRQFLATKEHDHISLVDSTITMGQIYIILSHLHFRYCIFLVLFDMNNCFLLDIVCFSNPCAGGGIYSIVNISGMYKCIVM